MSFINRSISFFTNPVKSIIKFRGGKRFENYNYDFKINTDSIIQTYNLQENVSDKVLRHINMWYRKNFQKEITKYYMDQSQNILGYIQNYRDLIDIYDEGKYNMIYHHAIVNVFVNLGLVSNKFFSKFYQEYKIGDDQVTRIKVNLFKEMECIEEISNSRMVLVNTNNEKSIQLVFFANTNDIIAYNKIAHEAYVNYNITNKLRNYIPNVPYFYFLIKSYSGCDIEEDNSIVQGDYVHIRPKIDDIVKHWGYYQDSNNNDLFVFRENISSSSSTLLYFIQNILKFKDIKDVARLILTLLIQFWNVKLILEYSFNKYINSMPFESIRIADVKIREKFGKESNKIAMPIYSIDRNYDANNKIAKINGYFYSQYVLYITDFTESYFEFDKDNNTYKIGPEKNADEDFSIIDFYEKIKEAFNSKNPAFGAIIDNELKDYIENFDEITKIIAGDKGKSDLKGNHDINASKKLITALAKNIEIKNYFDGLIKPNYISPEVPFCIFANENPFGCNADIFRTNILKISNETIKEAYNSSKNIIDTFIKGIDKVTDGFLRLLKEEITVENHKKIYFTYLLEKFGGSGSNKVNYETAEARKKLLAEIKDDALNSFFGVFLPIIENNDTKTYYDNPSDQTYNDCVTFAKSFLELIKGKNDNYGIFVKIRRLFTPLPDSSPDNKKEEYENMIKFFLGKANGYLTVKDQGKDKLDEIKKSFIKYLSEGNKDCITFLNTFNFKSKTKLINKFLLIFIVKFYIFKFIALEFVTSNVKQKSKSKDQKGIPIYNDAKIKVVEINNNYIVPIETIMKDKYQNNKSNDKDLYKIDFILRLLLLYLYKYFNQFTTYNNININEHVKYAYFKYLAAIIKKDLVFNNEYVLFLNDDVEHILSNFIEDNSIFLIYLLKISHDEILKKMKIDSRSRTGKVNTEEDDIIYDEFFIESRLLESIFYYKFKYQFEFFVDLFDWIFSDRTYKFDKRVFNAPSDIKTIRNDILKIKTEEYDNKINSGKVSISHNIIKYNGKPIFSTIPKILIKYSYYFFIFYRNRHTIITDFYEGSNPDDTINILNKLPLNLDLLSSEKLESGIVLNSRKNNIDDMLTNSIRVLEYRNLNLKSIISEEDTI